MCFRNLRCDNKIVPIPNKALGTYVSGAGDTKKGETYENV